MATLKEYATTDFAKYMTFSREHFATPFESGEQFRWSVRVHSDMDANSKFASLYLPEDVPPIEVTRLHVDEIDKVLKEEGAQVFMSFGKLKPHASNTELVFSGRVFVYAEQVVATEAIAEMQKYCSEKGMKLVWRSVDYRDERNRYSHPEAFISHDSRDKSDVAEPLALALQQRQCPVWYDQFSLKVGDSLRESIERGIKEANKCILILSPNFLANEGWTKAEFDSIYTREIVEKKRVILPVWHNVTREQVYEYSPRLADRVGANFADGLEAVVKRLVGAINTPND